MCCIIFRGPAIPDISLYQYDETSGYYYDPKTGLYYDANSQYYYNNEAGVYLYWDNENSTYLLAPTATPTPAATIPAAIISDTPPAPPAPVISQMATADSDNSQNAIDAKKDDDKKEKRGEQKQDKVKVAKKMMKDMEKWAKQLNQKKDMMQMPMQLMTRVDDIVKPAKPDNGYADVGFSILEKKDKGISKFAMDLPTASSTLTKIAPNKIVPAYGSDSDNEHEEPRRMPQQQLQASTEKDYVDFEKLTCLLCKRAFQSQDILSKHLKMSNLHKENLHKYNLSRGSASEMSAEASAQA